MDRVYTSDGTIIAKVMRDHLNTWDRKPVEIRLEDLGTQVPSMMIQQLSASEKKKSYVNGSYIGVWKFALYIRVSGKDTASRLDAIACLSDLSDWLTEKDENGDYVNLPEIDNKRVATAIELLANPSLAERYENGYEDYQALLSLEYKVRRN